MNMEDLLADGLVDVKEAAEFLRISRSTVYTLMDAGKLGYVKIGAARRIPKRALVDLAAASWVGPKPEHGISATTASETNGHHTRD